MLFATASYNFIIMLDVYNAMLDYEKIINQAAEYAGLWPGIYKMLDQYGKIIYIGKAKYLKKRLLSYLRADQMTVRLKMMVSLIYKIEIIVTKSEIEALILENNLIKQFQPYYNVLLKDDKTFPYIVIDSKLEFPRIFKYRTLQPKDNNFFGPYPLVSSLNEVVNIIQKVFLLRNCTDNCFKNAKRPCLQYFIKRCSAPCAGKISAKEYMQNVEMAKRLLMGKDKIVCGVLTQELRQASERLEFEKAAVARDKLKIISEIQSKQYAQIDKTCAMDFVAVACGVEYAVVFVTFFRHGKNVGSEHFIVQNYLEDNNIENILESFILQFYDNVRPADIVVVSHDIRNKKNIKKSLRWKTKIIVGKFGVYKNIMATCLHNANIRLNKRDNIDYKKSVEELGKIFGKRIERIEAYDNSHISGTSACGAVIVFEQNMLKKENSRVFNIDDKIANKGDDISMMKFSLKKRFASKSMAKKPSLILIDGGKTQLSAAYNVLNELQIVEEIFILAIAKQNNRKIGDEKVIIMNNDNLSVSKDLLYFLIMLRDEVHKKALLFHRYKRKKNLTKSCLDNVPSIGMVAKRKLLEHFGSVESIKNASVADLKMVSGIGNRAENVFKFFNK